MRRLLNLLLYILCAALTTLLLLFAFAVYSPLTAYNVARRFFSDEYKSVSVLEYSLERINVPSLKISSNGPRRSLSGDLQAAYSRSSGDLSLSLKDSLLNLNGMLFENISGAGTITLTPELSTNAPIQLKSQQVLAGIPLSDVHTGLTLKGTTLTLRNTTATLFGGKVIVPRYTLTQPSSKPQKTVVRLLDIDLAQVTDLLGQADLEVTGRVSGNIPIQVSSGGLSIDNGHVQTSQEGGIIKYRDDEQSSGLTALVRKALSNYHYRTLEADITCEADGELFISAHLKGSNPDLNKGQEVHVNLNIEQNVLSLLQSLRAKQRIEEKIEEAFTSD